MADLSNLRINHKQDEDAVFAFFEFLERHGAVTPRPVNSEPWNNGRRWPNALAEWKQAYRFGQAVCIGPLADEVAAALAGHTYGVEMTGLLNAIVARRRALDRETTGESLLAQLHALGYDTSNLTRR